MSGKIIGIGNAIIDIVSKVDEEFLLNHNLNQGTMSLIGVDEAYKLDELPIEKTSSGGSAGNTIATLSQLGVKTGFIGKVCNDDFGKQFISDISKSGTEFLTKNRSENHSAKSFILVTPDGQRTMCTFLGCASEISEEDINDDDFKDAEILYLEGYLWDAPETIKALKKAIKLAKRNKVKVAFTLSDPFCVLRHKKDFLELVKNDLDILFANESEILELTSATEFLPFDLAKFFSHNKDITAAITRSDKGCVIFRDGVFYEVETQKIENVTDTTGAGDCFAAGFLYGTINSFSTEKSGKIGNQIAAKIIQRYGARFEDGETIIGDSKASEQLFG